MTKIEIGTAGWEYKDWIGSFYPKQLKTNLHLAYFSKFFNLVEINSTFYNLPTKNTIENWKSSVPENFSFIVKVWQNISHKINDPKLDSSVIKFFSTMVHLNEKIAAFLLQFPPWFEFTENHLHKLKLLLNELPSGNKYIIELRDNSWFNTNILANLIDGKQIILGTTYMPGIIPYYLKNQNFYYIRLIGDRNLTVFDKIQRNQRDVVADLYKNVQTLIKTPEIYEIFIIVNNHFQGFAPESVNNLRKKFGIISHTFNPQKTLMEYTK